jgi:hypothetical protein
MIEIEPETELVEPPPPPPLELLPPPPHAAAAATRRASLGIEEMQVPGVDDRLDAVALADL